MKKLIYCLSIFIVLFACENDLNQIESENFEKIELKSVKLQSEIELDYSLFLDTIDFVRSKGKPTSEELIIGNEDLQLWDSCFVVFAETSGTKKNIVSSATIEIDGNILFSEDDFSKQAVVLSAQFNGFTESSILKVKLNGQPGSALKIWIVGVKKELNEGAFIDPRDNQEYKWVKIGGQIWMGENLSYETSSGSCAYNHDENLINDFGRLYKYDAAIQACPDGWHLPTDDEWEQLAEYISDEMGPYDLNLTYWIWSEVGAHLKNTTGWNENANGTNDFGFSAMPSGMRHYSGSFINFGIGGWWWTSTETSKGALQRQVTEGSTFHRSDVYKSYYFSVRCIKD